MIMEHELIGIGKVKMTVGIRRRTREKVQYGGVDILGDKTLVMN